MYLSLKEIDLSNYFYARHFKFLKEKELVVWQTHPLFENSLHLHGHVLSRFKRCVCRTKNSVRERPCPSTWVRSSYPSEGRRRCAVYG